MRKLLLLSLPLAAVACTDKSDADYRAEVVTAMHDTVSRELTALAAAARDLAAAAPDHAWSATADAAALTAMRDAWLRTRVAYEHVEGATAPIFPDFDVSMDARYDDHLARLGPAGDPTPFDGTGVTGMHAIERILYAPTVRAEVLAFEASLPGYAAPAWPATDADARAFKTGLCQRLITDADALLAQWKPAAIDLGAAYQGLVGLMNEQREKVNLASSGEEESRYANVTLFDLRNNLAGTQQVYAVFRGWIRGKANGAAADDQITAKLAALAALYDATAGDALPVVPAAWSSDHPSAADLATPFGMLWQTVHTAVAPDTAGSVVFEMNEVARLLGFPEFIAE